MHRIRELKAVGSVEELIQNKFGRCHPLKRIEKMSTPWILYTHLS